MIFLVDFVARGRSEGLDAGARYWVLFGSGAIVGPLISGYVGARIGFGAALRLGYLLQALAIALPAVATLLLAGTPWDSWALILSSVIVGALHAGNRLIGSRSGLMSCWSITRAEHKAAWGRATVAFATFLRPWAPTPCRSYSPVTDGNYVLLFMARRWITCPSTSRTSRGKRRGARGHLATLAPLSCPSPRRSKAH